MDRIKKFLKGLNKKEKEAFLLLMTQLNKDFSRVPGIKKLSVLKDCYRVRLGKYRIIFKVFEGRKTEIIKISKRDERTYKDL